MVRINYSTFTASSAFICSRRVHPDNIRPRDLYVTIIKQFHKYINKRLVYWWCVYELHRLRFRVVLFTLSQVLGYTDIRISTICDRQLSVPGCPRRPIYLQDPTGRLHSTPSFTVCESMPRRVATCCNVSR